MQVLTAGPRSGFTAAQVTAALTGPALTVGYGLDLLNADGTWTDISADCAGGEVDRDATADIHGTCKLQVSRKLAWGSAQVRPRMRVTSSGIGPVTFYLGVYLLTTPTNDVDATPQTYAVTGYDRLWWLSQQIGDSYTVAAGTGVLAAVRAVIAASGAPGQVLLDGTASGATLAADMAWPLTTYQSPTYLQVANDLLASIGYRNLWVDENGNFRADPYLLPAQRAVEWTHDVTNQATCLVGVDRTETYDLFDVPNWWRFIRRDLAVAPTQTDGSDGLYQVVDQAGGPNSINTIGATKKSVTYVDATDPLTLVTVGNQQVATDKATTHTITVSLAPFPAAWHEDIYRYVDPALGGTVKVLSAKWSLALDGSDGTATWQVVA